MIKPLLSNENLHTHMKIRINGGKMFCLVAGKMDGKEEDRITHRPKQTFHIKTSF